MALFDPVAKYASDIFEEGWKWVKQSYKRKIRFSFSLMSSLWLTQKLLRGEDEMKQKNKGRRDQNHKKLENDPL